MPSPEPRAASSPEEIPRDAPAESPGKYDDLMPLFRPSTFADAATLAVITWVHHLFQASFLYAPMALDEHFFVWQGWALGRGLVPYRDFQEFKPPMIFVVNLLALKIFGIEAMRYRMFFSLLSLASFLTLAVALLTRKVPRLFVLGLTTLFIALFFDHGLHDTGINDAESPAVAFFVMGSGVLLARTRFLKTQQIVGGVLFAFVPLTKEPLAPAIFAAWLCFFFLARHEPKEASAERRFAQRTIGAVIAVLAIWLGYMLVTRSLGWYIVQLKESFVYTEQFAYLQGREKHLSAVASFRDSMWRLAHGFPSPLRLDVLYPLCAASLAIDSKRRSAAIAAGFSCVGGLFAITVGHCFWRHYFVMGVPALVLFASIGAVFVADFVRRNRRRRVLVSGAYFAVALVWYGPRLIGEQLQIDSYVPWIGPIADQTIAEVQAYSKPDEPIWTLGSPLLYVYADRRNAVREGDVLDTLIDLRPGATDEEKLSGERAELERNPPRLVVFAHDSLQDYKRKTRYLNALVTPFLQAHHYRMLSDEIFLRTE